MTNNVYANMTDEIQERATRRAARDEHDEYISDLYRSVDEVRAHIEAKVETKDVHCVLGYALSMLAGFLGDDKDTARIHRKLFAEWRAALDAPGFSSHNGENHNG